MKWEWWVAHACKKSNQIPIECLLSGVRFIRIVFIVHFVEFHRVWTGISDFCHNSFESDAFPTMKQERQKTLLTILICLAERNLFFVYCIWGNTVICFHSPDCLLLYVGWRNSKNIVIRIFRDIFSPYCGTEYPSDYVIVRSHISRSTEQTKNPTPKKTVSSNGIEFPWPHLFCN